MSEEGQPQDNKPMEQFPKLTGLGKSSGGNIPARKQVRDLPKRSAASRFIKPADGKRFASLKEQVYYLRNLVKDNGKVRCDIFDAESQVMGSVTLPEQMGGKPIEENTKLEVYFDNRDNTVVTLVNDRVIGELEFLKRKKA